jgi:hypothetical protein
LEDIFEFSDEIKENYFKLIPRNVSSYISLHVRLGDKYLETDWEFIYCKHDVRKYNEEAIFQFIEKNNHENILLFSDHSGYKRKIKDKYNHVFITQSNIGHTSLSNTTEEQVLDSITDFYIMINSQKIYCGSHSGFSIIASKFKNIPLIDIH